MPTLPVAIPHKYPDELLAFYRRPYYSLSYGRHFSLSGFIALQTSRCTTALIITLSYVDCDHRSSGGDRENQYCTNTCDSRVADATGSGRYA